MRWSFYCKDILSALRCHELIAYRAGSEIKMRYKRTLIGPFWTTLSMAIFIIAFGVVGANLWMMDLAAFMPFFCAGYLAWTLISNIINESRSIFIANKDIMQSTALPIHVFVFELIMRNYIVFIHHLLVYAGILAFFSYNPGWNFLLLLPGLLIVLVASCAFASLWAIACTRYHDLGQLSANIMQIIFFLTPIMWPAEKLTGPHTRYLIDFNPMYHFVDIIRAPMLGTAPSLYSYGFTSAISVLLLIAAIKMFGHFRHRIVYWL